MKITGDMWQAHFRREDCDPNRCPWCNGYFDGLAHEREDDDALDEQREMNALAREHAHERNMQAAREDAEWRAHDREFGK